MMMVVCLLCCIAHLLSFIGLFVSWTGVVESGSGRPGELLLLLFTLWLLVICRRSRARKEATLDSISDWECLGWEFIIHNWCSSPSPLPLQHLLKFEALYGHLSLPFWDRQT